MKLNKFKSLTFAAVVSITAAASVFCEPYSAEAIASSVTFTQFDSRVNGGEPIRGVDVSSVIAVENAGVVFKDENGQPQDIFRTLAENGVNYVRVRVWNNPYTNDGKTYGGGNCDVYNAAEIGRRAAKYNIKLLVDFQYSDFWADPGKQTVPKAWKNYSHEQKKQAIYNYTKESLKIISDAGADIGMVQVGNETNCFFCGEKDMYKICELFSSGISAVREFDSSIMVALHFANPATGYFDWYAKVLNECKVDYDIFAASYYPYWHGTLDNLTSVLKSIGNTYHKYVMVAETAYPYTTEDGDTYRNDVCYPSDTVIFNYPLSVDGQAQCFSDVFQAVANCGSCGIGAFYWEAAWIGVQGLSYYEQSQLWKKYGSGWATVEAGEYDASASTDAGGSSYDNQALFDFSGKPLDSLGVFKNIYPQLPHYLPADGADIAEGAYRIRNLSTGKYLTVANGNAQAGANVVQYSADGAAEYNTWYIKSANDGYYYVYSALGGGDKFLLDLDYGKPDDRTNIGIYTNTNSDAQMFKFISQDSGSYVIATKSTTDRSAVEIADSADSNGGNIHQFTINGSDSQAWVLEPVEKYVLNGDLNKDGEIDIFDAALLKKCIISGGSDDSADTNSDGKISSADVITLQRFILNSGKIDKPSRGTPHNTIFPKV